MQSETINSFNYRNSKQDFSVLNRVKKNRNDESENWQKYLAVIQKSLDYVRGTYS